MINGFSAGLLCFITVKKPFQVFTSDIFFIRVTRRQNITEKSQHIRIIVQSALQIQDFPFVVITKFHDFTIVACTVRHIAAHFIKHRIPYFRICNMIFMEEPHRQSHGFHIKRLVVQRQFSINAVWIVLKRKFFCKYFRCQLDPWKVTAEYTGLSDGVSFYDQMIICGRISGIMLCDIICHIYNTRSDFSL